MSDASRNRWSDNDRYFGPFTYAWEGDRKGYRPLAIVLGSGDDDDSPGCRLRLSAFGHTLIVALPPIIQPSRTKVFPKSWDTATVERLGRNWYYDAHRREYGLSCAEGFLQVFLGRQTHDSRTQQSWSYFLPWTEWRHVRHSFYGLDGEHVAAIPDTGKSYRDDPGRFDRERAIKEATPTRSFAFKDFDGELLTVVTMIEEREWHRGTKWCKWLSLFIRPKVRRSLSLEFSNETGRRKGSWKGGTIGAGIDMLLGELHQAAFERYCTENGMTFEGLA